ncbi:MAG TPA: flagellar export protein FliJ [Tepidisphaeraceae bacterium]|jgi:flagellar FliJ protein
MPQFTFKLAAVLRHRQTIEREKQRDYALALARQQQLEDQLTALNQSMQATNDDIRQNHLVGRLDVAFITAHRRFLLGVQRKAMDLVNAIAKTRAQTETARLALAQAATQRMILEKLRDKQQQRWNDENNRKERIALDEIAMQMSADNLKDASHGS